ncbi:hypothetical protein AOQ84DRAFT_418714 [Glonium stellatum]|uniref:Piwi domain-containing protein n=1 Tax=Glonium stellatum TaxID=574774 RepID=A0A8E2ERJ1_9PEZI|nr:hypothetical protein AOQ84DRAFT_418714 [Glonium stellatum]
MAYIATKINIKTSRINHSVIIPHQILEGTLLGADVTHPGGTSNEGTPSTVAVVGSLDARCGGFHSSMCLQDRANLEVTLSPKLVNTSHAYHAHQLIANFQPMVEERILAHYQTQKTWLKRVHYYRDSVSEGQYSQVRRAEVAKIRTAFEHVVPKNQRKRLLALLRL